MSFNYVSYPGYSNPNYEFKELENNKVFFNIQFEISLKERIKELAKAILSSLLLVTLISSTVKGIWNNVFTGKKIVQVTLEKDNIHPHHWAVLNNIKLQFQQIFEGKQQWKDVLATTPEVFEFAPIEVKNNRELAQIAMHANPQMIYHLGDDLKDNFDYLSDVINFTPKCLYFYKFSPNHRKVLWKNLPQDVYKNLQTPSKNGIRSEDTERVNNFIEKYKHVWFDYLKEINKPYIYLKKRFLHIPCSLQIFNDGKIFVHSKEYVGSGTTKYVKAVYDYQTGQKLVKSIVGGKGFGDKDPIDEEYELYQRVQDQRGIVPVLGSFALPSKRKASGEKKVLISERYDFSLNDERNWTKRDLDIITLDMLYAIKAYQKGDLMDGDLNAGNIMVLCDERGNALKAGLIDFECAEIIRQNIAKIKDPKKFLYQMQTDIISELRVKYSEHNIESPFERYKHLGRFQYQSPGTYSTPTKNGVFEYKVEEYTPVDVSLLIPLLEGELKTMNGITTKNNEVSIP